MRGPYFRGRIIWYKVGTQSRMSWFSRCSYCWGRMKLGLGQVSRLTCPSTEVPLYTCRLPQERMTTSFSLCNNNDFIMHSCLPSNECASTMSRTVLYCISELYLEAFHLPLFWLWVCLSLNQLTGSHFRVLRTASHSLAPQRKLKPWTRRSITRSVCDVQWRLHSRRSTKHAGTKGCSDNWNL